MRIYRPQPQPARGERNLASRSSGRYVLVPLDALLAMHRIKALAEVPGHSVAIALDGAYEGTTYDCVRFLFGDRP